MMSCYWMKFLAWIEFTEAVTDIIASPRAVYQGGLDAKPTPWSCYRNQVASFLKSQEIRTFPSR